MKLFQLPRTRSLKVTITAAFLALSFFILTLETGLGTYFNYRSQKKIIANRLNATAREAANEVALFLRNRLNTLEVVGSISTTARSGRPKEVEELLQRILGHEPSFRHIVYLDAGGQAAAKASRFSKVHSDRFAKDAASASSDLHRAAMKGGLYAGPVYIDELTSEPMMLLGAPVIDALGEYRGAIVAEMNLKFLWELVGGLKIGDTGLAYVVDGQGNLIAFRDTAPVLKGENLAYLDAVKRFVNRTEPEQIVVEASKGVQGTAVISTFAPLAMPGWAVVVELPVSEAYYLVYKQIQFAIAMLLFSTMLALVLSLSISKKITGPVTRLRDAASKITRGNLHSPLAVESNDEIGELTAAFNTMTENLAKARNEIDEYNRTLEKRVEERTVELRRAQTKLSESEKQAVTGQLAAGMAHEINNPMGVILGFSQLMAREVKEDSPLCMPIKSIEREAQRCKKLVDNLLIFARTGKPQPEILDVNKVIGEMLALLHGNGRVRNIEIVKVFGDVPCISADKNQLEQVLTNLCVNALDAMPGGGALTITTRLKAENLEIAVADTGTGISDEVKKHLFEPFFTTKDVGRGTGLGLSICYEIVKKHGGTIDVSTEVGKGTTFTVILPAAQKGKAQSCAE